MGRGWAGEVRATEKGYAGTPWFGGALSVACARDRMHWLEAGIARSRVLLSSSRSQSEQCLASLDISCGLSFPETVSVVISRYETGRSE